ncbi:zona pellucida sperm-binding protein 3-like [Synchiropus picturatus]
MQPSVFRSNLLVVLSLSGLCLSWTVGFPQQLAQSKESIRPQEEQKQPVNTVHVSCHPDSLEILIQADLFEVGAAVNGEELRLGVTPDDRCAATAFSEHEYRIFVGLQDCGTKHWMTEDSLVYTNLLIFSPAASSDGVVRMDEAVIPIECHYKRRFSLSSSPIAPTWIPFLSKKVAQESLDFDLRIMTNDWLHQRSANVFHLGEPIAMEASVRVGHHTGLRVFVSNCVATLDPDLNSEPKYAFVEQGCLTDSQYPGSRSQFMARTEDDKLYFVIEAFRFHHRDQPELYITCQLTAVPVADAEAPNKACTYVNGRWRSADGNDYLCSYCQRDGHHASVGAAKFGARGMGKPAATSWRGQEWEQKAQVGPVLVLPPKHRSLPLPGEENRAILHKLLRPVQYGSQWKSGLNQKVLEKGPVSEEDLEDVGAEKMKLMDGDAEDRNATLTEVVTPKPETNVTLLNVTTSRPEESTRDPKR